MSFPLRFVLRQSSADAIFQHLAFYSLTQQLTHWVLPGPAQRLMAGQPYYLLCEAPLSWPLPAHQVDSGECTLVTTQEGTMVEDFQQALRSGNLQFHLHGQLLRGAFTLARLGSESSIWRFSVGHSVPYSLAAQS
jgi:hypothetical protein